MPWPAWLLLITLTAGAAVCSAGCSRRLVRSKVYSSQQLPSQSLPSLATGHAAVRTVPVRRENFFNRLGRLLPGSGSRPVVLTRSQLQQLIEEQRQQQKAAGEAASEVSRPASAGQASQSSQVAR